MAKPLTMNVVHALDAWIRWKAAQAMAAELEEAAAGPDYDHSPPRTSPLYDGPDISAKAPNVAKYMTESDAASDRATARAVAAVKIEATTRAMLLDALDSVVENRPPKFAGDL